MTKQETEALFMELIYFMCRDYKVEMPCPRCGKYSKKGLKNDSIVESYWNICPECAKKEPADKLPLAEWAVKNGGITMEFMQSKMEELEARIDEEKEGIRREFMRRRHLWDFNMIVFLLLGIALITYVYFTG